MSIKPQFKKIQPLMFGKKRKEKGGRAEYPEVIIKGPGVYFTPFSLQVYRRVISCYFWSPQSDPVLLEIV